MVRLLSTIIISFIFLLPVDAQLNRDNYLNVESKIHYGFIIRHKLSIGYLAKRHVPAFEFKLSKQTSGNKLWEELFRYPRVGIGYYWSDLGDPDVLGTVNAIYSFINASIIRKKIYSLNYNLALGFSYLSKRFDSDDNQYNIAIGSHGNAFFNFGFDATINITHRLKFVSGLGFTHFSNGAVSKPNLGFNLAAYNLGLNYSLCNEPVEYHHNDIPPFKRKNEIVVFGAAGLKEIYPAGGSKYLASVISGSFMRQLNHKRKVGFGTDLFYNASLIKELEYEGGDVDLSYAFRQGFHFSYLTVFDRLSLGFDIGYYTYDKYKEDGPLYSRVISRYMLTDHMFANLSLKTHKAVADFIEWGIGYSF